MFDRTTLVSVPERPVNIHIKQQPNDAADAARLYGQLRDKAQAEVDNAVVERLGADNELVVASIDTSRDYAADDLTLRVLFKINGRLHEVRCHPDRHDLESQLYRTVAEYVACEIWKSFGKIRGYALSAGEKP